MDSDSHLKMKTVLIFIILFATQKAFAGRPLITDDSGVLGKNKVQIETWLFSDERSIQHWLVPTFGIGDFLEVSASGVHGLAFVKDQQNIYAVSGPILQAKLLLKDAKMDGTPGFSLAGGSMPSFGRGYFKSTEWEYFYYLAGTSYVMGNDKVLVHANLGRQTRRQLNSSSPIFLWGLAAEVKTSEKTYWFAEASNGEVYALTPGIASQLGFRYDAKTNLQIDGTIGTGLSGNPRLPFWTTVGLKYVSDFFNQ